MALNKPALSLAIKNSLNSKLSALLGAEFRNVSIGGVTIPIDILKAIGEAVGEEVIDHITANAQVSTTVSTTVTGTLPAGPVAAIGTGSGSGTVS